MLESLAAVCPATSIAAIQVLADRARNARKRGRYDLAQARAEQVVARANRANNHDLGARGYVELAGVAQARGNYPDLARSARRALMLAERSGNRRIIGAAHSALGIRAALGGSLDVAVNHFATAYRLARPGENQFFEAVSNLAQVALDAGYARHALRIARFGLSGPLPLQSALALLGTAVLASATEGDLDSAIWATEEVQRLTAGDRHPREAALALTECWEAHTRLRRLRTASLVRKAALRLATTYGLPEILYRLDQGVTKATPPTKVVLRDSRVAVLSGLGEESNDHIHVAVTH
jgi:hypothetical protein